MKLYEDAQAKFAKDPAKATALATTPARAAPERDGRDRRGRVDRRGNVLLNLDEMLMKR